MRETVREITKNYRLWELNRVQGKELNPVHLQTLEYSNFEELTGLQNQTDNYARDF